MIFQHHTLFLSFKAELHTLKSLFKLNKINQTMKSINRLKSLGLQTAVVAALIISTLSCENPPKQEDTKKMAEEHNEAKFNTPNAEKDAQFLVNAAEISLEEIKLGELAQKNGQMADVKKLGAMMVQDHTKTLGNLTALANKKSITIPTSPTENTLSTYKNLSETKAAKFDKEYCDMMVSGHKDAISAFEKASTDANDPDIKQWAADALPQLRMHLDQSITCQKKCESVVYK